MPVVATTSWFLTGWTTSWPTVRKTRIERSGYKDKKFIKWDSSQDKDLLTPALQTKGYKFKWLWGQETKDIASSLCIGKKLEVNHQHEAKRYKGLPLGK